jgi:hypothetical protein
VTTTNPAPTQDVLHRVLAAHGGLARWREVSSIGARISATGSVWTLRGLAEIFSPRNSFAGHTVNTPWDHLHALYFGGYALWNYLNLPFLITWPRFRVQEIDGWRERPEHLWRRLRVSFPPNVLTHNQIQDLYVGERGLIVRHDPAAQALRSAPSAQYLDSYRDAEGLQFPAIRTVLPRGGGQPPHRCTTHGLDHVPRLHADQTRLALHAWSLIVTNARSRRRQLHSCLNTDATPPIPSNYPHEELHSTPLGLVNAPLDGGHRAARRASLFDLGGR